jgi:hypothetical protein
MGVVGAVKRGVFRQKGSRLAPLLSLWAVLGRAANSCSAHACLYVPYTAQAKIM